MAICAIIQKNVQNWTLNGLGAWYNNYYGKTANTPTITIQSLYVSLSISIPTTTLCQSNHQLSTKTTTKQSHRRNLSSINTSYTAFWFSTLSHDVSASPRGILSVPLTEKHTKRVRRFEFIATNKGETLGKIRWEKKGRNSFKTRSEKTQRNHYTFRWWISRQVG